MKDLLNSHSSAFSFSKSDDGHRISEIPMHTFGLSRKIDRTEEDYLSSEEENDPSSANKSKQTNSKQNHQLTPTSPFQLKNRTLDRAKNDWKVDSVAYSTNLLDDNHLELSLSNVDSPRIKQSFSKKIIIISLIILAVFISGFKGTAYLLVDLSEQRESCNNLTNQCVLVTENGRYILRALWRQILTTIFLIPLIFQEFSNEKQEFYEDQRYYQKEHIFDIKNIVTIVLCAFAYSIWVGTMAYSVFHTSMINAYIFNNIFPLFFVVAKFFPKYSKEVNNDAIVSKSLSNSVSTKEIIGTALGIAVLFMLAGENHKAIISELVALVGAIGASVYQKHLQSIRFNYPWMLAVFLLSLFSSIFFAIFSMAFERATLNMHRTHGLFGVFNLEWLYLHIFISLLTGVVYVKLFAFIRKEVRTVYVDIAIMCEAFAALLIAYWFSFEQLPNRIECGIYALYIIALVLLAYGKNDPNFEEIELVEEGNQKENIINSNFIIHGEDFEISDRRISHEQKNQYIPPEIYPQTNKYTTQQILCNNSNHNVRANQQQINYKDYQKKFTVVEDLDTKLNMSQILREQRNKSSLIQQGSQNSLS